jgi:hypothetical protein
LALVQQIIGVFQADLQEVLQQKAVQAQVLAAVVLLQPMELQVAQVAMEFQAVVVDNLMVQVREQILAVRVVMV